MEQNELFAALAKAQGMLSAPPKNREVEVFSRRTQSKYKFKYATLDAIIDHVRKPLTDRRGNTGRRLTPRRRRRRCREASLDPA